MDASSEMFNMFSDNKQELKETTKEETKPETFNVDDLLDN